MKNTLRIDFDSETIIMDRTFAAKARDTCSDEYIHLQAVRKDNPEFHVITRTNKKNPQKETYKGLTYSYMEEYILSHGTTEEVNEALSEYRELRTIAKCHKKGFGYAVIKKWFLNRYKEIDEFREAV